MDELAWSAWLLPRRAERVHLTAGARWEVGRSDRHLLVITTAGEGRAKLNGSFIALRKRLICGVPPGQHLEMSGAAGQAESLELILLEFTVHRLDSEQGDSPRLEEPLGKIGAFACLADERIIALGERLAEQWSAADGLSRLRHHAKFLELVHRIARNERDHLQRQAEDPLEAARRRMHDRYDENVTVGQLARWAGSSEAHFRERFRSRYGVGPLEYLTVARMRAARRLLLAPGSSVREVAHQVGYRDEFYFSRLFKQRTGIAPSAYAQGSDRRIAALGYPAVGQLLALGIRPSAAELFLDGYGRKAAAARERLKGAVGRETVLALCVAREQLLIYGRRNIGAVLYEDLGLGPAGNVESIEGVESIAEERLAEYEADWILLIVWEDEASRTAWRRLRHSAHWRRLKAVRTGRVLSISPFPWLEYTAFAHNAVIDEALKLFAAKRPSV